MQLQVLETAGGGARRCDLCPGFVQSIVAHIYDVPEEELRKSTRGGPGTAFARQVAMYLVHVVCGYRIGEVAAIFGRDRSAVSHACHHVEDLRDNVAFDRHLAQVEHVLREAARIEIGR